jgi:hypothetical protein
LTGRDSEAAEQNPDNRERCEQQHEHVDAVDETAHSSASRSAHGVSPIRI